MPELTREQIAKIQSVKDNTKKGYVELQELLDDEELVGIGSYRDRIKQSIFQDANTKQ